MRYTKPWTYVHPATGRPKSKEQLAIIASRQAIRNLVDRKLAARFAAPRAAVGSFPYYRKDIRSRDDYE